METQCKCFCYKLIVFPHYSFLIRLIKFYSIFKKCGLAAAFLQSDLLLKYAKQLHHFYLEHPKYPLFNLLTCYGHMQLNWLPISNVPNIMQYVSKFVLIIHSNVENTSLHAISRSSLKKTYLYILKNAKM